MTRTIGGRTYGDRGGFEGAVYLLWGNGREVPEVDPDPRGPTVPLVS